MKPTKAQLGAFWARQGDGPYTCDRCGRVGPRWEVQPQHPYYANGRAGVAWCHECINAINVELHQHAKARRALEPRCEVPGCQGRRRWKVGGGVWLCGRHKTKAIQGHQATALSAGGLALFLPMNYDRADVLAWASGKGE